MTSDLTTPGVGASTTDARRQAWRGFIETSARITTILDEDLRRAAGMSLAEYHILLLLDEGPAAGMRMRDLAGAMAFSSSRLSYQVDSLARRGWVLRCPAPDDRRGSLAALTDQGRQAFIAAAQRHSEVVEEVFIDALDGTDGTDLARVMGHLATHLDSHPRTC